MIRFLYFITFLASLAVLIDLLVRQERIVTNLVLMSLLVTVNAMGRCLLSVASSLELALMANMMIYVGACFCPLMVITILSQHSHITLPRWLETGLTLFSWVLFALVVTIGHSPIYYSSVSLVQEESIHYLMKEYGPAHVLFPIMILLYAGVIMYILGQALRKKQQIPFSSISLFVIITLIILFAYVLERIMDTHVSYVSLGYFIAMVLLMQRVELINMYDLPTNIASSIEAMNEIAYLEFDRNMRCTGYNRRAKELFPEIEETCPFGKRPVKNDSPLYTQVISWIYSHKKGQTGAVTLGDLYYEMNIRDIPYRNQSRVGILVELVDRTAEKKYTNAMEVYNDQLKKDVASATAHISHIKDMMVVGMASMVESRDDSTGGHIKRTYGVMRTFSEHLLPYCSQLGVTPEFLDMVTRAAPMHDLGKIAIDDAVLKKQGRFTDADYEIMKRHPEEGAKIVRHILTGVEPEEFVNLAENVAHYHHERWDGKGYPCGLKGEEIPLEARLMALPDVCDALLSKRCYKEAFTYDQVFTIIGEGLGTQFDPVLGKYFMECRPELEQMYQQWHREDRDAKLLELEPVRRR